MDAFCLASAILFVQLGNPDFNVREVSHSRLGCVDPGVLLILRDYPDPEVQRRVAQTLEGHRVAAVRKVIEASRPVPWIDALGPDHPERYNTIYSFLDAVRGCPTDVCNAPPGDQWPSYRLAMELYLLTLTAKEARILLEVTPKDRYWGGQGWIIPTPPPKQEQEGD